MRRMRRSAKARSAVFTLAANGTTTNGLLDTSLVGTGPTSLKPLRSQLSSMGPGPSTSSGRGTLTIDQNNVVTNYVYYIVSAGKIFITLKATLQAQFACRTCHWTKHPRLGEYVGGCLCSLSGIDSTTNPSNNISAVGVLQVTNLSGDLTWGFERCRHASWRNGRSRSAPPAKLLHITQLREPRARSRSAGGSLATVYLIAPFFILPGLARASTLEHIRRRP